MPYNSDIELHQKGESLTKQVLNRPLQKLFENTEYLLANISSAGTSVSVNSSSFSDLNLINGTHISFNLAGNDLTINSLATLASVNAAPLSNLNLINGSNINFNLSGSDLTISSTGASIDAYTKTELNTSGAGGQVHWNNVTNKDLSGFKPRILVRNSVIPPFQSQSIDVDSDKTYLISLYIEVEGNGSGTNGVAIGLSGATSATIGIVAPVAAGQISNRSSSFLFTASSPTLMMTNLSLYQATIFRVTLQEASIW